MDTRPIECSVCGCELCSSEQALSLWLTHTTLQFTALFHDRRQTPPTEKNNPHHNNKQYASVLSLRSQKAPAWQFLTNQNALTMN